MGWLLAALVSGVFAFNSAVTPGKAAQKAEAALEKRFPGASVDVEIEGKRGADVLNGKFKRVHIEMANFTLTEVPFESVSSDGKSTDGKATNGKAVGKLGHAGEIELGLTHVVWRNMPLESARFKLTDVDYDLDALKDSKFRFARLGKGTAEVKVQARSLGAVVASRLTDVSEANVEIRDGQFHVSGKRNVLGLGAPFKLTATPVAAGAAINLRDARVTVGGLPVPGMVVGALLGKVNPIYSFDEEKWPFEVAVRQVDARDERLRIEADLALPDFSLKSSSSR